jgi:hypothetical protein
VSLSIGLERRHDMPVGKTSVHLRLDSDARGEDKTSPDARKALIWLEECRTMVALSFISARFLGADVSCLSPATMTSRQGQMRPGGQVQ